MDRYQLFARAVALSLGAADVAAWPWDGCDEDWSDPVYVDVPSLDAFCVLDLDADTWTNQVEYAVDELAGTGLRQREPPPTAMTLSTSTVELTSEEIATLIDALDSHEYWQIAERGDRLPVHNGAVWLPGDYDGPGDSDPYWSEPAQQLDEVTTTAIREARQVRRLEAKLRSARAAVARNQPPGARSQPRVR